MRYGSIGALVQPERQMNHIAKKMHVKIHKCPILNLMNIQMLLSGAFTEWRVRSIPCCDAALSEGWWPPKRSLWYVDCTLFIVKKHGLQRCLYVSGLIAPPSEEDAAYFEEMKQLQVCTLLLNLSS